MNYSMNKILSLLSILAFASGCQSTSGSASTAGTTTSSVSSTTVTSGALSLSPSSYYVSQGQSIDFSASGGTAPYSYRIVSGGGSIGSTSGSYLASSSTGTVYVAVRDSAGAEAQTAIYVNNSGISLSASASTVTAGSAVTLTASGGSGTYSYSVLWGYGSITNAVYTSRASDAGNTVQLAVTDSNGLSASVSVAVSAVSPLVISPATVTVNAYNSVDFSAIGGVAPYSFAILSGIGNMVGNVFVAPATSGTSIVQVIDSSGRVATSTVTIRSLTNPSGTFSSTVTLLSDDSLGVTFQNASGQSNPSLIFFGTGSKYNSTNASQQAQSLAHTVSNCWSSSGNASAPCVISIPLTNFDNTNVTTASAYIGTVTYQGRSGSGTWTFCVDRNSPSVAYIQGTTNLLDKAYNYPGRMLLGGESVRAAYASVDTNDGYGNVQVSISNAGYTGYSTCGEAGYSASFGIHAN